MSCQPSPFSQQTTNQCSSPLPYAPALAEDYHFLQPVALLHPAHPHQPNNRQLRVMVGEQPSRDVPVNIEYRRLAWKQERKQSILSELVPPSSLCFCLLVFCSCLVSYLSCAHNITNTHTF
ncbi:hypothetical protein VTL71DRAFT_1011 [Oculimacula yallundae]|uniref:Uncharacterized protein n=1 Tax=Oculimacula yallundae TaxID=86028 RepID=A0ABR4D1N2_9HELO